MTTEENTNAFGTTDQVTETQTTEPDHKPVETQPTKVFTYAEGDKTKTFKSDEEIFNAYSHSQKHIGTLEQENAGYRSTIEDLKSKYEEVLEKQNMANDVLEAIKAEKVDTSSNHNQLTTSDLDQYLETREAEKRYRARIDEANSALTSAYAEKAPEHVAKVAGENGMTAEDAVQLAGSNPILFKRLFLPKEESPRAPTLTQASITDRQLQNLSNNTPPTKRLGELVGDEAAAELNRRREEIRKQLMQ